MKTKHILLVCVILTHFCYSQTNATQKLYNELFKWSVTIPEGFEKISAAESDKFKNKGINAIEDTFGETVIDESETIFVFKNGPANVFEANYQPFDTEIDGDYSESRKAVNDILYETFKTQMPKAKITRSNSTEKIDGLTFYVHTINIELPNKMVLKAMMFNRLFGKREFTVNIMFLDKILGEQLLDAWRSSTFGK